MQNNLQTNNFNNSNQYWQAEPNQKKQEGSGYKNSSILGKRSARDIEGVQNQQGKSTLIFSFESNGHRFLDGMFKLDIVTNKKN